MKTHCKKNCELESVLNYLAERLSPVLFGTKPAMLLGLHRWDKLQSCPMYFSYQQEIHNLFGVEAVVFSETERMTQIYFYRKELVQNALNDELARQILRKNGYNHFDVESAVERLKERFTVQSCPHELGIFVGYPPKDVAGYIAGEEPVKEIKGPWRVYGEAEPSLKLMKKHSVARKAMRLLLQKHKSVYRCMTKLYNVQRIA